MSIDNIEPTDERILEQLEKLSSTGVIQYVVPTIPLGESWVVGVQGTIVKMATKDEVLSFLAGVSAATNWFVEHVPAIQAALGGEQS